MSDAKPHRCRFCGMPSKGIDIHYGLQGATVKCLKCGALCRVPVFRNDGKGGTTRKGAEDVAVHWWNMRAGDGDE